MRLTDAGLDPAAPLLAGALLELAVGTAEGVADRELPAGEAVVGARDVIDVDVEMAGSAKSKLTE